MKTEKTQTEKTQTEKTPETINENTFDPALSGELVRQAQLAWQNAYAPYSRYQVGAAALFSSGQIYSGCNVENASYGLSVCAERNAIFQGIARGERELKGMAIAVPGDEFPVPCGACLQVIREFSADCPVILVNGKGQTRLLNLSALLPEAFGSELLLKNQKPDLS